MASLATLRLQLDDSPTQITIDVLDGDGPALVFLHGMTSTRVGTKSERLLERARSRGQAYARFDFRGHGDSDGDIETMAMSDLIADTRAVVGRVGESVLVGSSLGGLVAAFTAADSPDVRALVLMSPSLGFLPEMAKQTGSFELLRSDQRTLALGQRAVADAARYDESALPAQLSMPVFMVHGTEDRTIPSRVSQGFFDGIAHVEKELWLIEGGSHSLSEDIDDILDRMDVFLIEHGVFDVRQRA